MASSSDNPQSSTAASQSARPRYYLIEELNEPAVDHYKLRNEASGDLAVNYHKMLDKMRDAWIFAGAHYENPDALRDLRGLEPGFIQQVGRVRSLREVGSRVKMTAIRDTWQAFCDSKGNALKSLYGIQQ